MGDNADILLDWQTYYDLRESQRFLHALEAAGVDNWEGYDEAVSTYNEENDK